jgi:hypothetical protein
MKQWTRGELQAIAAASRFLAIFGLIVVCFGVLFLVIDWKIFVTTLPSSLISFSFLISVGGIAMVVGGFMLSNYVRKYEKKTGESSFPFRKTK